MIAAKVFCDGRGIFLMRNFMNQVDFRLAEGTATVAHRTRFSRCEHLSSPNYPTHTPPREAPTSLSRPSQTARARCCGNRLMEGSVEFKGDLNKGCEQDQWLQLALSGDRETLGHLFASRTPQLYRAAASSARHKTRKSCPGRVAKRHAALGRV
jgi:hypothetical protein